MKVLLIVLCFVLEACFILQEKSEKYTAAVGLKGLASLCFVTLGFLCAAGKDAGLLKLGLLFGMGGDILLNLRYVFKEKGQKVFLVGILVFLVGHIFYLVHLLKHADSPTTPMVIGIVASFFLLRWIFSKVTAAKAFKIFGVFYVGAVTMMAVTAIWNLAGAFGVHTLLFGIGGLAFLVSDIILIMNTFTGSTKLSMRVANLTLYYIGQVLIACSLLYL